MPTTYPVALLAMAFLVSAPAIAGDTFAFSDATVEHIQDFDHRRDVTVTHDGDQHVISCAKRGVVGKFCAVLRPGDVATFEGFAEGALKLSIAEAGERDPVEGGYWDHQGFIAWARHRQHVTTLVLDGTLMVAYCRASDDSVVGRWCRLLARDDRADFSGGFFGGGPLAHEARVEHIRAGRR